MCKDKFMPDIVKQSSRLGPGTSYGSRSKVSGALNSNRKFPSSKNLMSRKSRNELVYQEKKELSFYKDKCEHEYRRMGSIGKMSDTSTKKNSRMGQTFHFQTHNLNR